MRILPVLSSQVPYAGEPVLEVGEQVVLSFSVLSLLFLLLTASLTQQELLLCH